MKNSTPLPNKEKVAPALDEAKKAMNQAAKALDAKKSPDALPKQEQALKSLDFKSLEAPSDCHFRSSTMCSMSLNLHHSLGKRRERIRRQIKQPILRSMALKNLCGKQTPSLYRAAMP